MCCPRLGSLEKESAVKCKSQDIIDRGMEEGASSGRQRGKGNYCRGKGMQTQANAQGNTAGCSGTGTSPERLHRVTESRKSQEAGGGVEGRGGRVRNVSAGFFPVPVSPCSNFTPQSKLICTSGLCPLTPMQHREKPNPCHIVLHLNLKIVGALTSAATAPIGPTFQTVKSMRSLHTLGQLHAQAML